jgi:hypothetical protein
MMEYPGNLEKVSQIKLRVKIIGILQASGFIAVRATHDQFKVTGKKLLLLSFCLFSFVLTGCRNQTATTSNNSNRNDTTKYLSEESFRDVCQGSKVVETAAYDKTPGTASPIYIFYQQYTYQNYQKSYDFPNDWESDYTNTAKTQLVACITVSDRKEKRICPYQRDNKTYKLKLNDAKYNVKIYEAQTGALVAEKDFQLKAAKECPMIMLFTGLEQTEDPDYEQTVINFLKPYLKR